MKQLTLLYLLSLLFFTSCKKDEGEPGTTTTSLNSNAIIATRPPAGFRFPKTFKESHQLFDFEIWVKGMNVTNNVNPKNVFSYSDWPASSVELTLLDTRQINLNGMPENYQYFFYKNGLYIVDGIDTIPFPIALGNYSQIELYDYQIKITSGGSYFSKSVFEKSTKATLEKEGADWNIGPIDTMAYINRSLIMK